jgi:hypothetical protein
MELTQILMKSGPTGSSESCLDAAVLQAEGT